MQVPDAELWSVIKGASGTCSSVKHECTHLANDVWGFCHLASIAQPTNTTIAGYMTGAADDLKCLKMWTVANENQPAAPISLTNIGSWNTHGTDCMDGWQNVMDQCGPGSSNPDWWKTDCSSWSLSSCRYFVFGWDGLESQGHCRAHCRDSNFNSTSCDIEDKFLLWKRCAPTGLSGETYLPPGTVMDAAGAVAQGAAPAVLSQQQNLLLVACEALWPTSGTTGQVSQACQQSCKTYWAHADAEGYNSCTRNSNNDGKAFVNTCRAETGLTAQQTSTLNDMEQSNSACENLLDSVDDIIGICVILSREERQVVIIICVVCLICVITCVVLCLSHGTHKTTQATHEKHVELHAKHDDLHAKVDAKV
eukprot:g17101.t1